MFTDIGLLLAGLVLLFFGGEFLVRGAVSLANRLGLSPLVIGLTVVGFGTSAPELLVSVDAALRGSPDIAVGNVVGSNIANVLLILGLSALVWPIAAGQAGLRRDMGVMVAATVLLLGLAQTGVITRLSGMAMVVLLAIYLFIVTRAGRKEEFDGEETATRMAGWKEAAAIIGGLAALMLGADLLVGAATNIARSFGVSEAVIGLTIVAVGTSLPELATSLVAALRRHSDVAIGNVVGSNIFNILGILGVASIVTPLPVAQRIAEFDVPLALGVALLLAGIAIALRSIGRIAGGAFLAAYLLYVIWLF
jgi:cation:H+ antiporter